MRLDHLLSKEQLTPSDHAKVRGTVGVQCCSFPPLVLVGECSRVEYQQAMAAFSWAWFSSTPHLVCGWNVDRVRGLGVFWHTVGSWNNRPVAGFPCGGFGGGSCFFWFPAHGLSRTGCTRKGVCVVVGVTGLLFGNCIVDASIL